MRITPVILAALLAAEPALSMPKGHHKKKNNNKAVVQVPATTTVALVVTATIVPVTAPTAAHVGTPTEPQADDNPPQRSPNMKSWPPRYISIMQMFGAQKSDPVHVKLQNIELPGSNGAPGTLVGKDNKITANIRNKRLLGKLDPNNRLRPLRDAAFLKRAVDAIVKEFEEQPWRCQWEMDVVEHVNHVQRMAIAKQFAFQPSTPNEEEKAETGNKKNKSKKDKKKATAAATEKQKQINLEDAQEVTESVVGKIPCSFELDDDIITLTLLVRHFLEELKKVDSLQPGSNEIPSREDLRNLIPENFGVGAVAAEKVKQMLREQKAGSQQKVSIPDVEETKSSEGKEEEKVSSRTTLDGDAEGDDGVGVAELRKVATDVINKHYQDLDSRNEDLFKKMLAEVNDLVIAQRKRCFKSLQNAYRLLVKSLVRTNTIELLTFSHVFDAQQQSFTEGTKAGMYPSATDAMEVMTLIDRLLAGIETGKGLAAYFAEKVFESLPLPQRTEQVNTLEDEVLKKDGSYNALKPQLKTLIKEVTGDKVTETSDLKLERIKLLAMGAFADQITKGGLELRFRVEEAFIKGMQKKDSETPDIESLKAIHNIRMQEPIEAVKEQKEFFPTESFLGLWANYVRPNWYSLEMMNLVGRDIEADTNQYTKLVDTPDKFFEDPRAKPLIRSLAEKKKVIFDARKMLSEVVYDSTKELLVMSNDDLVKLLTDDEKKLKALSEDVTRGSVDTLIVGDGDDTPEWLQKHTVWFDAAGYFNALLDNDEEKKAELTESVKNIQIQKKTLKTERERWLSNFVNISPVKPRPIAAFVNNPDEDIVDPRFKEYVNRWKYVNGENKVPEPPILEKARLDSSIATYVINTFPAIKAEVGDMIVKGGFAKSRPSLNTFDGIYEKDKALIEAKIKSVASGVVQLLRDYVETVSFQENAADVMGENKRLKEFLSDVAGPLHVLMSYKPTGGTDIHITHPDLFLNQFIAVKYLISKNYEKIAADMDDYLRSVETETKKISLGDKAAMAEISKARASLKEILDAANPDRLGSEAKTLIENTKKRVDEVNILVKQKKSAEDREDPRKYWGELHDTHEELSHLLAIIDQFQSLTTSRGQTWTGYKSARDLIPKILKTIEDIRLWLVENHPNVSGPEGNLPRPCAHDHMDSPASTAEVEIRRWQRHIDLRIEYFEKNANAESDVWWKDLAGEDDKGEKKGEWPIARGFKHNWDRRIDNVRKSKDGSI